MTAVVGPKLSQTRKKLHEKRKGLTEYSVSFLPSGNADSMSHSV